jgi:hypothetical protein
MPQLYESVGIFSTWVNLKEPDLLPDIDPDTKIMAMNQR